MSIQPNYVELVKGLAQAIRDDEATTKQELDERIRDMGYDPDKLATEMRALIIAACIRAQGEQK